MSKPGEIHNVICEDDLGKEPHWLSRPELAERLGVAKERLHLTVVNGPLVEGKRVLLISVLLDGGDLPGGQVPIFVKWLEDNGIPGLATFSEKPVTS